MDGGSGGEAEEVHSGREGEPVLGRSGVGAVRSQPENGY